MSAQHTPGPWEANLDAHGRGRIKGNGCWVATTWTTADDDSDKRHPAEANARLIAKAPEMLEALKDAYPYIADDALRERVGNLIAKATGVQA